MRSAKAPHPQRISRQILIKVLFFGIIIVASATVYGYYLVYNQTRAKTIAYLSQYMRERKVQEDQIFLAASAHLEFFRDEFLKLYLSNLDFSDQDFWNTFSVDENGATRSKEELYQGFIDPKFGRTWGVTSFIGSNQSTASHDFQRRLLIALLLVNRYGPAWTATGLLHATFPENAMVIFSPDDPWGLEARHDLPMNELGTIKATLQSENPKRSPVWTGLYYDETVGKWTITFELPVDYQGRHLVNPSLDVSLASIMQRLEADHPQGAYNFIVSKNGFLIAHPGDLKDELKKKGQLSLEKLNDPDLTRMYQAIRLSPEAQGQGVAVIEDGEGGDYLLAAPLAGPDWWFVTVYPKERISQEAHQASRIVLLLGASLFVLFFVAVYFIVSHEVRSPLGRLEKAVEMVARGEYEEVIARPEALPLELKNEIGQLAKLFLDMCREVNGVNANLQNMVEARTAELESANARLRDLSLLDGLTGMRNRRAFDREFAAAFDRAKSGGTPFSLLLADVDHFKSYNDLYGHTAGDEALRKIAETIANNVRQGDLVYRYGGEEIAVILTDASRETAIQTGARILKAVGDAGISHQGSPHGVLTLSAGVVEFASAFLAAIGMIDAADANLYLAKSAGRNALRPAAPASNETPDKA